MDEQTKQALELVAQPVFFAQEGRITWRNATAAGLLAKGMELSSLVEPELLTLWPAESTLHLNVVLAGREYLLSLRRFRDGLLFVGEPQRQSGNDSEQMEATAAQLRRPLQTMFAAAQTLFESAEIAEIAENEATAQISRSMYQILRLCGQLSDGGRALRHALPVSRRAVDAKQFFDKLAETLEPLVKMLGMHFFYRGLTSPCRVWMDETLIERAAFNLAVNAVCYTPRGGTITLSVEVLTSTLAVRLRDDGEGLSEPATARLSDFSAPLTTEDARRGLGLGLVLVREIARLHGGSLMMAGNGDQPGTTALFSVTLRPAHASLRSPELRFDYAGGCNHGLVEFSELLPETLYAPENIF